ncbi:uncharacterized protein LOC133814888 [Humulus lupulus]|uniref:uncharacterized protein LOC133814888 n=1 Tax=Humulus lupulus TaxID=3486 RepID=UPI002B40CE24|nr:uncharacterized protein LOC133814888 [Humulus lupulus]
MEHKSYRAMRELNMDATTTRHHRSLELNEMDEFHNESNENAKIYKDHTKAWHDKNLVHKEFQLGQRVLLFNSRLKLFLGKLKSRRSGPFTMVKVFPYGAMELQGKGQETFRVNGQRVKPYMGGPIDPVKTIIQLQPL